MSERPADNQKLSLPDATSILIRQWITFGPPSTRIYQKKGYS